MRRLRLFRRRRKSASTRTVDIVFRAHDEFTPVLEDLTRQLAEVEERAVRAHKAVKRAQRSAPASFCGQPDEEY